MASSSINNFVGELCVVCLDDFKEVGCKWLPLPCRHQSVCDDCIEEMEKATGFKSLKLQLYMHYTILLHNYTVRYLNTHQRALNHQLWHHHPPPYPSYGHQIFRDRNLPPGPNRLGT